MASHKKDDPEKDCQTCGKPLERRRFASGRLEDRGVFLRRKHCSLSCANTRKSVVKNTMHWRARKHLAVTCEVCGTASSLHVHHIDRNPANNNPENLATLCASCHLKRHWSEDREKRMAVNPWVRRALASDD